jgi:hypothetical protein
MCSDNYSNGGRAEYADISNPLIPQLIAFESVNSLPTSQALPPTLPFLSHFPASEPSGSSFSRHEQTMAAISRVMQLTLATPNTPIANTRGLVYFVGQNLDIWHEQWAVADVEDSSTPALMGRSVQP